MKPLSNRHRAILDIMIRGVDDENSHRRIDNAPGSFMAVVVEKIGPERYSVAHYYEQNGDKVADPDLEVVRQDGGWFPVAITQWCGYRRAAETDENGRIVAYNRASLRGSPTLRRDVPDEHQATTGCFGAHARNEGGRPPID